MCWDREEGKYFGRQSMVAVGIIGTGFGRIAHVPGFLQVANATVVGVASREYQRARDVANAYSLPKCFSNWEELVDSPEVEAVTVASPPGMHREMVLRALAAGKHVLCEKPFGLDTVQSKEMLQAARAAGVVHMVNFELREIPTWQCLKQIVATGELGRLRHAKVDWILGSWADPNRGWSWRSDREQGGGTLGSWVAHVFDYVEWLLGPIGSLSAHLYTAVSHRPDEMGIMRSVTSDDCGHILLELEEGAPVSVTVSPIAPVGKGHWIEIYGEHKAVVMGSSNLTDYGKGFAIWEGTVGSPKLRKRPLPEQAQFEQEFADGRVAPFAKIAQRFVNAIEQRNMDVHPNFEDGLRSQILMEAAFRAHQERKWIDVSGGPAK